MFGYDLVMKKTTVIIDIDDTIADTQVRILAWINERSERVYTWDEMDRSYREGKQPEYEIYMQQFLADPDLASGVAPYQDALESIKSLHKAGLELHLVTARDTSFDRMTQEWLKAHGFIDYIEHTHHRPAHQHGRDFKREVATALLPLAAFDDTYDVGLELAHGGVYVYLIDKPWNLGEMTPAAMERVPSFSAGVRQFLKRHRT